MTEENKYYTPELNEFHVGFEYEEYYSGSWHSLVYDGSEVIVRGHHMNEYGDFYDSIEEAEVRVKYLSKECIESLGWKAKDFNKDGTIMLMGGYAMEFYMNHPLQGELKLEFHNKDKYVIITNPQVGKVAMLTLNNKSELKKLLKMLNISND